MNRKIKKYRAISYGILFYLFLFICLLGPVGILKEDRLVAGNELIAGTTQVRLDRQIQQVIVAQGTYLRYMDLYVASPEAAGQTYQLRFYDEQDQKLYHRDIALPEEQIPGFLRIPIGIPTEPGHMYVWQMQGKNVPAELAYENTADTGLTAFGNYYVAENGEILMQEAQNIVMRLTYTDSPAAWKMAILYTVLLLAAAFLIGFVEYQGQKGQKLKGTVTLRRLLQLTAAPALALFAGYLLYAALVRQQFGTKMEDLAVYGLGIGLACVWFAWFFFAKCPQRQELPIGTLVKEKGMDWLQTAAFAGLFSGTIHFMNALYQYWQNLAYREVLIWLGLVLLTMGTVRTVARKESAIWLVVSAAGGLIWYWYQKLHLTEEEAELTLRTMRYDIVLVMVAGLVVLAFGYKIKTGAFDFSGMNRPYAGLVAALFVMLVIFRNGRGWPIYLVAAFTVFYLFYFSWEKRERLLGNFCNGIILNFALATVFCLARRPYRAWVYSRYNFVFHTVTITATYLTLVICALTVRLLGQLYRGKKMREMWGTLLLYGFALSFLFMTLSRTGYLAVIAMTVVLVPLATLVCYRQGIKGMGKALLCMAAAAVFTLPMAYTGIRILPAVYNDPYIYEVEESSAAIHKDDPMDSTGYMSVSYFKYVMENKLFAEAASTQQLPEFLQCFRPEVHVESGGVLVAAQEDMGLSDLEEFSNGRFDIFRSYMENWNLTGHEEMGVPLPDGSLSVHAHNTYLQVIHDHGLLTGGVYLLFGTVSVCMMFVYAIKRSQKETYALLPLSVFIGFAVASLVEWLFHPCNPIGFSTMVVFAPLLNVSAGKSGKNNTKAVR